MLMYIFLLISLSQYVSSIFCMEDPKHIITNNQCNMLNLSYDIWENDILKSLVATCYKEDLKNERMFLLMATPDNVCPTEIVNTNWAHIPNIVTGIMSMAFVCKTSYSLINKAIPKIIIDLTHNYNIGTSHSIVAAFHCSAARTFEKNVKDLKRACTQRDLEEIKRLINPETVAFYHNAIDVAMDGKFKGSKFLEKILNIKENCITIEDYEKITIDVRNNLNINEDFKIFACMQVVLNFCHQPVFDSLLHECIYHHYNKSFAVLFNHNNHLHPYNQKTKEPLLEVAALQGNHEIVTFLLNDH